MWGLLHRKVRNAVISELNTVLRSHPYYSPDLTPSMKREPIKIVDCFNFDGRQFPAIVVETTSTSETRLAMNRFITGVVGHVRPMSMMPIVLTKIMDDPNYQGTYIDAYYILEVVNAGQANKETLQMRRQRVRPINPANAFPSIDEVEPIPGERPEYFDLTRDSRNSNIIPGAIILTGSHNDLRQGTKVLVQTFATPQALGNIYGSRHKITADLKVYAQSQYQTEELVDWLLGYFTYLIPQRLCFGEGIDLMTTNTSTLQKEGELGEEIFSGTVTLYFSVENQFFVPLPLVTSYTLSLEMRERIEDPYYRSVTWDYGTKSNP